MRSIRTRIVRSLKIHVANAFFEEEYMKKIKRLFSYFSRGELVLWAFSVLLITVSFCIFDRSSFLSLTASLLGATSLIFCAKGNPVGQVLIIIFSILYGIISYSAAYYGEMITYVGMTMPMAVASLVSWVRHPFAGKRTEVCVNRLKPRDVVLMLACTAAVTVVFYFILGALGTANLLPGTISVATSFAAVFLTSLRSPYYAVAYGLNDIVLIILWALAVKDDISYVSVLVCFVVFLANDIYGFINWRKMQKRQENG